MIQGAKRKRVEAEARAKAEAEIWEKKEKKRKAREAKAKAQAEALSDLSDEDYEYKLAGVLVHAGVAQGGHYYSFIKDRSLPNGEGADKWFRFDDEDVTPFDPSSIEVECFGGKVKKETKFPNGQVAPLQVAYTTGSCVVTVVAPTDS